MTWFRVAMACSAGLEDRFVGGTECMELERQVPGTASGEADPIMSERRRAVFNVG
jgi:hypothetical protein